MVTAILWALYHVSNKIQNKRTQNQTSYLNHDHHHFTEQSFLTSKKVNMANQNKSHLTFFLKPYINLFESLSPPIPFFRGNQFGQFLENPSCILRYTCGNHTNGIFCFHSTNDTFPCEYIQSDHIFLNDYCSNSSLRKLTLLKNCVALILLSLISIILQEPKAMLQRGVRDQLSAEKQNSVKRAKV